MIYRFVIGLVTGGNVNICDNFRIGINDNLSFLTIEFTCACFTASSF